MHLLLWTLPPSLSLADSPIDSHEAVPKQALQKHPVMLGKLDVYLGLSFSHQRNSRSSVWWGTSPEEGWCSQNEAAPFTLPMQFFTTFVIQEGALASLLGSGIFTKMFCLSTVASCSFCEGNWNQEQSSSPSCWCYAIFISNTNFGWFLCLVIILENHWFITYWTPMLTAWKKMYTFSCNPQKLLSFSIVWQKV